MRQPQVGVDVARCRQQRREQGAAHLVQRGPAGVRRDVDGSDDPAGAVVDRRREGPQPLLQLLVDQGPSLARDGRQRVAQRAGIGDRALGQRAQVRAVQVRDEVRLREVRLKPVFAWGRAGSRPDRHLRQRSGQP